MVPGGYGLVASLDPERGQAYGQLVAQAGLEPLVTRDGAEAETALRNRGAPGLMVTELSLPRADGFSLLQTLRALASPDESPVVVVNAFSELHRIAERLKEKLGIAAILGRDAGPQAIDAAIRRALEHGALAAPVVRAPAIAAGRPQTATAQTAHRVQTAHATATALGPRLRDDAMTPIASEVRRELGVPVVVIALLAGDGIVVPARLGVTENLPELLLFGREVADARELLVVPDTASHPWFARGTAPLLRGYAAAPVMTASGEVVGVLCVADDQPLALGAAELDRLTVHARRVAGELELATALPAVTKLPAEASPALAAVLLHIDAGALLVAGGRIVHANPAVGDLVDVSPHRLEGMTRSAFVAALATLAGDPAVATQKLSVPGGAYAGRDDVELVRPGRRIIRWTARPLVVESAGASTLVELEVFADVTAQVDLERERQLFARTDWLTGLANRRGGEDAIAREVARARRLGSTLCFALFDADGLGAVNDLHGQAFGDELLRELARIVRGAIRGSDIAIRWGGDELLVALPGVREAGARVFAERVRKRVDALCAAGQLGVTVSAGVSELAPLEEALAAIGRADSRMFQAKAGGRNRIA